MKVTAIATIIAGKDAKEYLPGTVLDIPDQQEANYLIERGLVAAAREKKEASAADSGEEKQDKKGK